MGKRYTDTQIWKNQRWFKQLSPAHKLAWKYIGDHCDHAGIWKIDCADLMDEVGIEEFDLKVFIEKCSVEFDKLTGSKIKKERLRIVNKNILWVTGFIQFQYENKVGSVPSGNPIVKSALEILKGYHLYAEAIKSHIKLD